MVEFPYLRKTWKSWQIRRPALDGDPRLLLKEIEQEDSQTVISTAFETGIGRRWINHLAARQVKGEILVHLDLHLDGAPKAHSLTTIQN